MLILLSFSPFSVFQYRVPLFYLVGMIPYLLHLSLALEVSLALSLSLAVLLGLQMMEGVGRRCVF